MRDFNTAGPVRCDMHYCLPPLGRLHLEDIMELIYRYRYFVLHAPRQTGKTSCLLELQKYINKRGKLKCLYVNVEIGQAGRDNVKQAMQAILSEMALEASLTLNDNFLKEHKRQVLEDSGELNALNELLSIWSKTSESPIVLLIDGIDALVGDTLISVLRQLRAGYKRRPDNFPQSIVLCGLRDVRDYRIYSKMEGEIITGGSAFNIKSESLRLGDFNKDEVFALYRQHAEETGQVFEDDALDLCRELTRGQPWLVNALGYEVCFRIKKNRDRTIHITSEMIEEAKENLILRRDTHIDQLTDKLKEERVHKIIAPMLLGLEMKDVSEDDKLYSIDLGLIKKHPQNGLEISNPIYREVIPRYLTIIAQDNIESMIKPAWYINKEDNSLNMHKLLASFQEFFQENSEHWVDRFDYKEAGPQLLLQAFLQRIVNRGGRVEREYGLGRMRTDILITWFSKKEKQRFVIETKIKYNSMEKTIEKGLEQTMAYMDRCNCMDGHLIIFDRSEGVCWDEKLFTCRKENKGKTIFIWGM